VFLFVCFTHFLGFKGFLRTQIVFVCFTPDFLGFKDFKEHKFYLCVLLTFEMLKQLGKGLNLKFKL
jgi:hypothetical protein